MALPALHPGPGYRLGEYTLGEIIGRGSMAAVFAGRDRTGHEVAIKVFRETDGVSSTMLERFRREAEATKKLRRHPYILTVYNTGQQDDVHYIVMERIPHSRTLDDLLDEGKTSIKELLSILHKVGSALDFAHAHHIVHRDVKPSNIMIDEFGEPLLADFGVAELVDWPSCTVSGALTGTPMYMSPEQARADRVGPASDIYSLGVVAYEALTGELPYELPPSPLTGSVLEAVKTQRPIPARRRNTSITRDLEFVLMKALAKDTRQRYPSMKAFLHDLESVRLGTPVRTRLLTPLHRIHFFVRSHRLAITLIGTALVLSLLVMLFVRDQLARVHQEQLLSLARQRDAEFRLMLRGRPPASESPMTSAWAHLSRGRELMRSGNWEEAQAELEHSISHALTYRDNRTLAIARIEAARCLWMRDLNTRAEESYMEVLNSQGASPISLSMAFFECHGLLIVQNRFDDADAIYARYAHLLQDPLRMFSACIQRRMAVSTLLDIMPQIPVMFQNDALLAIALREHRDGKTERAKDALLRARKLTRTTEEWPAPLAAHLENLLVAP